MFRRFLDMSGQSFDRFDSAKPPEPDIAAWRGNGRYGIELTTFYREAQKARESEEDKLVELAQGIYESQGGINVQVAVSLSPHFRATRRDAERLAPKIAALVEAHVPPLRKWVDLDWQSFDLELGSVLIRVCINRLVDHKLNLWHASRGGAIPRWQQSTLQSELDRKNGKRAKYREAYVEVWLLLVSTFIEPSSWMDMTDAVKDGTYKSEFDRVFLSSSSPHTVFELRLREDG